MMGKKAIFAFLLALIITFSGNPKGAEAAVFRDSIDRGGAKEATLMIYMTGSDLESSSAAATKDMQEMVQSAVDLNASNVIIYTGGTQKWHSDVPDDANAVLKLTEAGFERVETFQPMSMGAAENLTRFLNYAYRQYPATTYYLILWDHGNGPVIGYCLDKQYENDTLTLSEMEQALAGSPFSAENKLGFIGFDACLMASAELICTVGDYAEYLIASQETEPNFGWNYAFLEGLGKLPAKELACSAADRYYEYCEAYYEEKPFFHSDVTMSVTDLSYAEELRTDICGLFRKAAPDVNSRFSRIAVSRVNTRAFGRASTGSEYDLVDLRCLSDELSSYYPTETETLNALLDRMIVHTVANTEQSSGVSLYYPFYNKSYYSSSWKEIYRDLNVFPDYLNFMNRYEQMWLASDMQEVFDTALNVEPGTKEGTYYLPLSEEQMEVTAEARFYILRRIGEGLFAPVYVDMNVQKTDGGLLAAFDGNVICFETQFGIRGIPATYLRDRVGTKTDYSVLGFILEKPAADGGWSKDIQLCDLQLSADSADDHVEVKGIYEWDSEAGLAGSGKRQEMDLTEWVWTSFMELSSRYLTRDEKGRIIGFWDWPTRDSLVWTRIPIADNVQFTFAPLYDDGFDYCIMFELMDVQGSRICSEVFPIEVEKAPHAQEPEPTVIERNEDGSAELTVSGVHIVFRVKNSLLREQKYYIEVTNENDFPIQVNFDDISVHSIATENSIWFFSIAPGETQVEPASALTKLIWKSGQYDQIRFRISGKNVDNDGTLFCDMPIRLADYDASMLGAYVQPLLGAGADEQVLYLENGIEVTLLGLGFYPDQSHADPEKSDAELTAYFRIDNTADEPRIVAIPAFGINGVDVTNAVGAILDTVELPSHHSCYFRKTVTRAEAQGLTLIKRSFDASDPMEGYPPLADRISSLSALVVIENMGVWCPIELREPTAAAPYEPEGKLLYEDETWRVLQEPANETAQADSVALWIANRTDQTMSYYLFSGGQSFASGCIGPNAIQRLVVQIPEAQRSEEFRIRSYSWIGEYYYQVRFDMKARTRVESGQFRILTAKEATEP